MPEFRLKTSVPATLKHALEQRAAREGTTVAAILRNALEMDMAVATLRGQRDEILAAVRVQGEMMNARLERVEAVLAGAQAERDRDREEFAGFRTNLREFLLKILESVKGGGK